MVSEHEYRVVEKTNDQERLVERSWRSVHSNAAHKINGPAIEKFDPETGNLISVAWVNQLEGGKHREGCLPAVALTDAETGVVYQEEYYLFGLLHRDDGGPTKIRRNRLTGVIITQEFHSDGRLHRDFDLPAIMEFDPETRRVKRLEYYHDGVLHRSQGPAIVEFDQDGKMTYHQFFRRGKVNEKGSSVPRLDC